ncbi:flagellar motor protein MotB [Acidithiobacillus marinus]|uniref:Flagellar motor protein MotB n=1 Tax=Acidithiobacillus marinus TaxID=187490 RepID=A0A2I1DMW6_9PROT|nr:flagellar motor protein MotD [Acidithiobacillus marinus]PKY11225.1 flagellar motor protein MotB [Acidithiobacillus marinus]
MARKKKEEEWENHERWLVSYADFITLLFAFFVVMYAISSVNEGKYKVLSKTLVSAFSGQPWSPVPIRSDTNSLTQTPVALPALPKVASMAPVPHVQQGQVSPKAKNPENPANPEMQKIEAQMRDLLKPLIEQGSVAIHRSNLGIVIDLNAKILFPSAAAQISPNATSTLSKIAKILAQIPYQIQVNGFTNDLPIRTPQFRSNWALSAARAVSVVELFIQQGVNPHHLVAAGYGKYHPVASNNTAKGLIMNRRVSIVVVAPQNPSKAGTDPIMAGSISQRG